MLVGLATAVGRFGDEHLAAHKAAAAPAAHAAARKGKFSTKFCMIYFALNRTCEELDAIAAETGKVNVVHVLSHEEKEGFEHGFLTAELIRKYAGGEPYSVFVSGPAAMHRFVGPEIDKLGLEKKYVRKDFPGATRPVWEQPGYPADKKDRVFRLTVRQGPNETVCDCSANEPILVAIERAGIRAPSRCRSGECGWCRSRVVSGEAFIPEETDGRRWADKRCGEIHPCASYALSDMTIAVPGEYVK